MDGDRGCDSTGYWPPTVSGIAAFGTGYFFNDLDQGIYQRLHSNFVLVFSRNSCLMKWYFYLAPM